MRPLPDAGRFEIVGIGHCPAFKLLGLFNPESKTVAPGIGNGLIFRREPQFDLLLHVT